MLRPHWAYDYYLSGHQGRVVGDETLAEYVCGPNSEGGEIEDIVRLPWVYMSLKCRGLQKDRRGRV